MEYTLECIYSDTKQVEVLVKGTYDVIREKMSMIDDRYDLVLRDDKDVPIWRYSPSRARLETFDNVIRTYTSERDYIRK